MRIYLDAIYLDYNATTPVDPSVCAAMLPFLEEHFGNPSSDHVYGRRAHDAVEQARAQVARLIGAHADEIVFTGGGSEANNLAIKGVLFRCLLRPQPASSASGRPEHVITSAIEHPAVLGPCRFLQQAGCRLTVVPVDGRGLVDPEAVREALRAAEGTRLVTIMHANNEVGTIQPIPAIARLCREHGTLIHTDAAQTVGKIRVDVSELDVDLLTIAGHKLYAPKGVGALYVRRGVALEPLIHGAGHETGRRAGTENVPYVVALGQACALVAANLPEETDRLTRLRDRLWQTLRKRLGDHVVLGGHPELRLPNTLHVNFRAVSGHKLLERAPGIAASTGAACHSGQLRLSPVLEAMGVPPELGLGAVRLSVGRFTTPEEIERAADLLERAYRAACSL